MNRGAKAVISLALGAILMLGIYHVYRPQINSMANGTFGKVQRMVGQEPSASNSQSKNTKKSFTAEDWAKGVPVELVSKNTINPKTKGAVNILYGGAKYTKDMPKFHNLNDANKQKISNLTVASQDPKSFEEVGNFPLSTEDVEWNSGQIKMNNTDHQYYLALYTEATNCGPAHHMKKAPNVG